MTIPNLITIFRLVLVPVVIMMLLLGEWSWALALFVIAGLSDGLDGYIARKFDMHSEFGAMIDPLADKVLIAAIYISLAIVEVIPAWLAIIVVSRDVMIVMAFVVSWTIARPMRLRTLPVGKVTTALQIAFAAVVLGGLAFALDLGQFTEPFAILIALLTTMTAILYLLRWMQHTGR